MIFVFDFRCGISYSCLILDGGALAAFHADLKTKLYFNLIPGFVGRFTILGL